MFSTSESSCQAKARPETSTNNIRNTRGGPLRCYCKRAAHKANQSIPHNSRNFVSPSTVVSEFFQRTGDVICPSRLTVDTTNDTVTFEENYDESVGEVLAHLNEPMFCPVTKLRVRWFKRPHFSHKFQDSYDLGDLA